MDRVYNFSAGPSVLPIDVLKKAQEQMLCYESSGMGVMEMSHRSKDYESIIGNTENLLRKLMNIPLSYQVLFLQGGASTQFSMIPMNLMKTKKADYMVTGDFAKKSAKEAEKYGEVKIVASSSDKKFSYIPKMSAEMFSDDADYLHITSNNTIYGTKFNNVPPSKAPIVADMSSCILSEPINVADYGMIYAGAQKNMGPAGLCVVIIREDLVGNCADWVPTMMQYKTHVENDSMYNTPPTYAIYICGLMLEWLNNLGGVPAMHEINKKKAGLLYDYLDSSKLFSASAAKEDRSLMNVTFVTGNPDLDAKFISEAKKKGIVNIKGHRSVGGMRASIYNAMPIEGIEALVGFMKEFDANN